MWKDNTKGRILEGDHYERIDRGDAAPFNSQEYFVEEAEKMNKQELHQHKNQRHFTSVFETLSKHVPSLHLNNEKGDADE